MSRWIDADALIEAMGEEPYVWTDSAEEIAERNQWLTDMHIIESAPSIDIVRCKECRHWEMRNSPRGWCEVHQGYVSPNYYCADGIKTDRKTEQTEREGE